MTDDVQANPLFWMIPFLLIFNSGYLRQMMWVSKMLGPIDDKPEDITCLSLMLCLSKYGDAVADRPANNLSQRR